MSTILKIFVCIIFSFLGLKAQDSLSIEALTPMSYTFNIEDGVLVGEGSDFLKKEISLAQSTLLGDYRNSKNIAELITALAPELQRFSYDLFATGVGVGSAEYLNRLSGDSDEVTAAIRALNDQYKFREGETWRVPIPEMTLHEDAQYLSAIRSHGMQYVGFGNESFDGLLMLLDQMWEHIPKVDRQREEMLYQKCKKILIESYRHRNGSLKNFVSSIEESEEMQSFLEMASYYDYNIDVAEAFKSGLAVARMYAQGTYYQKNKRRVYDEKRRLTERLTSSGFNLKADRIFVKWDINYVGRGFSNYGFFEVGNMMSELASYNGHQSLHIGVLRRYYLEDGVVRDDMDNHNPRIKGRRAFLSMGQKDQWTIIDLRPLQRDFYYYNTPQPKYRYTEIVEKLVQGYDLIIIPPTEAPGRMNSTPE